MTIYWFKAQAPRHVLALAKHLGVDAEFIEVDMQRTSHHERQACGTSSGDGFDLFS